MRYFNRTSDNAFLRDSWKFGSFRISAKAFVWEGVVLVVVDDLFFRDVGDLHIVKEFSSSS